MRRKNVHIGKLLTQATAGILGTAMDVMLFQWYYLCLLPGKYTMAQQDRAWDEAEMMLAELNHTTIARALSNLLQKGLIKRLKTDAKTLEITDLGKKRISELIPTYKEKRPWDGYLYLVSYDIPTSTNTKRDLFRDYLKKIGCGKLQDSLWMTPYNPTGVVNEFIDEYHIPGTILVSKLGKDGTIGDEDRQSLIVRIYQYEKLTKHYDAFIQTYTHRKNMSKTEALLSYHAILRDDPQLPFALEPDGFPARDAYALFQSLIAR